MSDHGDGLPDLGGFSGLLEQAQKVMEAQQQAAGAVLEGQSGGGVVRIEATGGGEFLSVTIAPEAVDPADVEMLQDLVLAALHDVTARIVEMQQSTMGALGGLGEMFGAPPEPDDDA
jgi:DNA-binding YbaB/EbfC family protein